MRAMELLTACDCVRRGGFVYVETSRETPAPAPFPEWRLAKQKVIGEVRMQLWKKD